MTNILVHSNVSINNFNSVKIIKGQFFSGSCLYSYVNNSLINDNSIINKTTIGNLLCKCYTDCNIVQCMLTKVHWQPGHAGTSPVVHHLLQLAREPSDSVQKKQKQILIDPD